MSIANKCLIALNEQNWSKMNLILSEELKAGKISDDPTFQVFESYLVTEIKKLDKQDDFDLPQLVLVRLLTLFEQKKIDLSQNCLTEIAEYLFSKNPSKKYADLLPNNNAARKFIQEKGLEIEENISQTIIADNLNVKIGTKGKLEYSKRIVNSQQEEELFNTASRLFPDKLVYPNLALSVIISDEILETLTKDEKTIFFTSSIDLCIIDRISLMPLQYFELDSSWHDSSRQIKKDATKDEIFKKAGLKLIRVRKKENKTMSEAFELFLKEHVK